MDIDRELAIQILRYLAKHKDFYFPFRIVNKEYSDDEEFADIDPSEWKFIEQNKKYRTFRLRENLQDLYEDTTPLLAKGFIEKITGDVRKITFTITEEEVQEVAKEEFGRKLSGKHTQAVLNMVECDEMLAKDIRTAIVGAISEL